MLRADSGASAAEYAVILAIIGTAIAGASFYLGAVVSDSMNDTAMCISSSGGNCPS
jgi:pilus assembly protein Flp/PilA